MAYVIYFLKLIKKIKLIAYFNPYTQKIFSYLAKNSFFLAYQFFFFYKNYKNYFGIKEDWKKFEYIWQSIVHSSIMQVVEMY